MAKNIQYNKMMASRLDHIVEVVLAYKQGKIVQSRQWVSKEWQDNPAPAWDFNQEFYRVKPGVRQCIVVFTSSGQPAAVYTVEEDVEAAAYCARINGEAVTFKGRE